ncbi:DivIVA domain-containing protein [Nocardia sp. NPDC057227]|uniref:DivIVA domain-containing protein n=1 Tax=Nocardia sp. NPDC057227 TaxID=3346056 RepID=UPI003629A9B6
MLAGRAPAPPRMTPDEVGRAHFDRPPLGQRGYHADRVDEFLKSVAATLAGAGALTADDVRRVTFPVPRFGGRGYQTDQVDEYLDRIRLELESRQNGGPPAPEQRAHSNGGSAILTPDDVHRVRFTGAVLDRRGYDEEEVDAFLDLVATTLAHTGPGTLTAADVREVRFTGARLGARGYSREEVDAFLDLVVTALEQRR